MSVLLSFLVLTVAGFVLAPLEERAWQPELVGWPQLKSSDTAELLPQGAILGLVGGLRAMTANILWLRSSIAWEKHDVSETDHTMSLALTVDSRPIANWQNAAMILAFDIPHWKIQQLPADLPDREVQIKEIRLTQGRKALVLLTRGLEFHPYNTELYTLAALIQRQVFHDYAKAADIYGYASTLPYAPYFLARIRGELLREMGQNKAAYEWYRAVYESLPDNVPEAQKPIVLHRLRLLEATLNLPTNKCLPQQD